MFNPIEVVFNFLTPESLSYGTAQLAYAFEDSLLLDRLKIIGAVLSVLGLIGLIIVSMLKKAIDEDHKASLGDVVAPPQSAPDGGMSQRWHEIESHINSEREAEWKFAVIEADKLMEEVLRVSGFPGDSMGETLMNIQPGQIASLQDIWEAHKIRNRLVHDSNYFLRYGEARRAIDLYRKALIEFGIS